MTSWEHWAGIIKTHHFGYAGECSAESCETTSSAWSFFSQTLTHRPSFPQQIWRKKNSFSGRFFQVNEHDISQNSTGLLPGMPPIQVSYKHDCWSYVASNLLETVCHRRPGGCSVPRARHTQAHWGFHKPWLWLSRLLAFASNIFNNSNNNRSLFPADLCFG